MSRASLRALGCDGSTGCKVGELRSLRGSKVGYRAWFYCELNRISRAIDRTNRVNDRVRPGAKWGHGTKVLSLRVASVALASRSFTDTQVARIEPLLYVPIDSVVIGELRNLGVERPFRRIREIDSAKKFFDVQRALGAAAKECPISPAHPHESRSVPVMTPASRRT